MAGLHFAAILVLSYLAGSFPTSILAGKIFFRKDIRNFGSGNAGGTNTVRVFGWPAGVAVILIDIAKGAAAVLLIARLPLFGGMDAALLPPDVTALCAGSAAVIGHIWTVFAGFRGGKGVATAAGMIVALYPLGFVLTLAVFVLTIVITGIVSAGSLAAAIGFPVIVFVLHGTGAAVLSAPLLWFPVPIAVLILFSHRTNIIRFVHGEEKPMFGKKKRRE
ncbi:MAG: glycerol-3-phosphate 1-O-acyltransferase PlsY [Sediminispirochaetaceae bacterium]